MRNKLTLAVTVSLLLSAQASVQEKKQPPTAPPQNRVNKSAAAEVCGRYVGHAVVEVEKTTSHHGALFMLAGPRFVEDGTFAWTASSVAPWQAALLEKGA